MKYLVKFLTLVLVFSIMGCDDDEPTIIASVVAPPTISSELNGSTVVLTEATSNNIAVTFTWSPADFDVTTVENYELLMGMAGNEFATQHSFGTTSNTFVSITAGDFNNLLADPDIFNQTVMRDADDNIIPAQMEAKVIASLGSLEMESDVITFSVVPFELSVPPPLEDFFVVGSFLAAGGYGIDWNAPDGVQIVATQDDDVNFEGFVYMPDDGSQFKFLPTNENFDGDYGDTGDTDGSFSGTLEQDGEVNCGTPDGTGGYYLIRMDIEGLTYSLEKTSWAITGEATPNGWPADEDPEGTADQDMTYDSATKTWVIDVNLVPGEFKFRANDAWDLNIGADNNGDGSLDFGGDNFSIDAGGNYRVVLDLSNSRQYTYSVTPN
ncbi:SusE domain-containing protein [Flagellimonas sp. HMM57]|uniref:SusE domain-containing protein n=1 Tax=unclassified Flagellimonas TaxID=2644544 RepID=UPI0013D1C9C7|nr:MULTISPECIES: SusE domain-containing protein [unclassified Flagellimonas]UII76744.1 SusE domain-containing protein [Flagellimonas sp. HMM57]